MITTRQNLVFVLIAVLVCIPVILYFSRSSSGGKQTTSYRHVESKPKISMISGGVALANIPDIIATRLVDSDAVLYKNDGSFIVDEDMILEVNRSGHLGVVVIGNRLNHNFLLVSRTRWCDRLIPFLKMVGSSWKEALFGGIQSRIGVLLSKWPSRRVIVEDSVITIFRMYEGETLLGGRNFMMRYPLERWHAAQDKTWFHGNGIPKIVVQTWVESQTNVAYLAQCQRRIRDLNPGYDYVLFTDFDMRRFIRDSYGSEYSYIYEKIEPGAYRSDFFRLLFLLKYGGVYADMSLFFQIGFDEFLSDVQSGGVDMVVPIDNQSGHLCLFNAFMMVSPNHPVIRENVKMIISHVRKGVSPRSVDSPEPCLYLTGPCSLGSAFLSIYAEHTTIVAKEAAYARVVLLRHIHRIQSIQTLDGAMEIAATRHRTQEALVSLQMKEEIGKPHYSEFCSRNEWLIPDPSDRKSVV